LLVVLGLVLAAPEARAQDAAPVGSTAAPGTLAPAGPAPNAIAPVLSLTFPAIVKMYGAGGFTGIPAYGTGVIVDASGVVATAWSIALKTDALRVVTDSGQHLGAKLVRYDTRTGLALVKIDTTDKLPFLELGDSEHVRPGDEVYAIGNAFDDAAGDEKCAVTHGIVSALTSLDVRVGIEDGPSLGRVIVTTTPTNPGTQGGALLDRDGKLVGILGRLLESKSSNTLVNYAMTTATLRPFLADFLAGREPPQLGPPPRKQIAVETGIKLLDAHLTRSPMAYVDRVVPGSPADKAGVKADDLIFRLDGRVVRTCRAFEDMLHERSPGEKVKLLVKRGNALVELELELTTRREN
jgi:serine protease Do